MILLVMYKMQFLLTTNKPTSPFFLAIVRAILLTIQARIPRLEVSLWLMDSPAMPFFTLWGLITVYTRSIVNMAWRAPYRLVRPFLNFLILRVMAHCFFSYRSKGMAILKLHIRLVSINPVSREDWLFQSLRLTSVRILLTMGMCRYLLLPGITPYTWFFLHRQSKAIPVYWVMF